MLLILKFVSRITSRILVPHDGSEMSDKALDKAIEFSKAFKSEIIILHIVDDRLLPSSAFLAFIGSKLEDAKIQALNILRVGAKAILKIRTITKLTVQPQIGCTSLSDCILEVATHPSTCPVATLPTF